MRVIILISLMLLPATVFGQGPARNSVSLIYEAIAATNAPLWLGEDARLFEKYGLDVKVVHARGAVPGQALVTGSVGFGALSGSSRIAPTLAGTGICFRTPQ